MSLYTESFGTEPLFVLEYFLAPMQAVLRDNISHMVCCETFIAGRYYKYPEHLPEMNLTGGIQILL